MKTIVWDVDDVLNDLMRRWLEDDWRPGHAGCKVEYDNLHENPPCGLLGCSLDEYLGSLDCYRLRSAGMLEPNPKIVEWFSEYGGKFRHVALTATPIAAAPVSAQWVMTHFGAWIRSFSFVPSPRKEDPALAYEGTKEDYLRWWGHGDILIDDNSQHVEGANRLGMQGLLVPRPWNGASGSIESVLADLLIL
jgi:hypothetical protein